MSFFPNNSAVQQNNQTTHKLTVKHHTHQMGLYDRTVTILKPHSSSLPMNSSTTTTSYQGRRRLRIMMISSKKMIVSSMWTAVLLLVLVLMLTLTVVSSHEETTRHRQTQQLNHRHRRRHLLDSSQTATSSFSLLREIRGGGGGNKDDGTTSTTGTKMNPQTQKTKFPIVGDIIPDPFVLIAPLIVGVVCRDGVLLLALHPGGAPHGLLGFDDDESGGDDDDDGGGDYENFLRMGCSSPSISRESSSSSSSSSSPEYESDWYDVIDVPPTYRGPFRIHVLQDEYEGTMSGSGSSAAMVSAGWRSDGQYLASRARSLVQQDKQVFGPTTTTTGSGSAAFMMGQYLSTQISYSMALQAVGTEGKRPFSCASLIASASSSAPSSSSTNGFLWLADSTGIYQVRAHAVGGGLVETRETTNDEDDVNNNNDNNNEKKEQQESVSSLASLVNRYLVEKDWTTISCEDAAKDILQFLYLSESTDDDMDNDDDDTNNNKQIDDDDDTVVKAAKNESSKENKKQGQISWTVPKGTRVELAVMGTSSLKKQNRPFKRLFAADLFGGKKRANDSRSSETKTTSSMMEIRGGGGSGTMNDQHPMMIGELKIRQNIQESYIDIYDDNGPSKTARIRPFYEEVDSDLGVMTTLADTLALLCDIIILDLTSDTSRSGSGDLRRVVSSLNDGMNQRTAAGLNKGVLIVIVGSQASDTKWVQHLVQSDLATIQPSQWDQLEIVESSVDAKHFLNNYMTNDGTKLQSKSSIALLAPNESPESVIRLMRDVAQKTFDIKMSKAGGPTDSRGISFKIESSRSVDNIDTKTRLEERKDHSHSQSPVSSSEDPSDIIQSILSEAQSALDSLESRMQSVELESMSSNPLPILDFGRVTNDLLTKTNHQLNEAEIFHNLSKALCRSFLSGIVKKASELYNEQVRSLRNYYGQRYEVVLSKSSLSSNKEKAERQNADAAQRMIQEFQVAAKNAIPQFGNKNEYLSSFQYSSDLEGLIQDMMEATERMQDDSDLAGLLLSDEDDDAYGGGEGGQGRRRFLRNMKVPKWLERIAARAVVFGVNYFQGWLAYQGIKRAALERDKKQPKFPLF